MWPRTNDYYLTWEAKKLKKEVQGVADHSRRQAQKKYQPGSN